MEEMVNGNMTQVPHMPEILAKHLYFICTQKDLARDSAFFVIPFSSLALHFKEHTTKFTSIFANMQKVLFSKDCLSKRDNAPRHESITL